MAYTRVMLAGGPIDLRDSDRVHDLSSLDDEVKITRRAGYEHFSHCGDFSTIDGDLVPVFHWSGRTKFAE